MKMKKKLIALSILAASVVSASSMAAVTTGQLTFNWQGVIPTSPVVSSAWAFVDGLDNVFIPGTEQLRVNLDDKGDMTAVSVQPYDFFIVPVVASATSGHIDRDAVKTFATNGIKAYLGTNPVSNGFNGDKQLTLATKALADASQVAITLNGTPLVVGSSGAIDVGMDTAKKEAHVSIELNTKVEKADITEGGSISFTAPVIFAADIV